MLKIKLLIFFLCKLLFEIENVISHRVPQSVTTNISNASAIRFDQKSFGELSIPRYIDFDTLLADQAISVACRQTINRTIIAASRETWALAIWSTWGRFPPTGFTDGTLADLGDFDLCIKSRFGRHTETISIDVDDPNQTQYCLIDLSVPLPKPMPKRHNLFHETAKAVFVGSSNVSSESIYRKFERHSSLFYYAKIRVATCFPRSCDRRNDIDIIARKHMIKLGFDFDKYVCQSRSGSPTTAATSFKQSAIWWWILHLNSVQRIALAFFVMICLVSAIAAIYDFCGQFSGETSCIDQMAEFEKAENQKTYFVLLWFSPIRNVRKLISGSDSNHNRKNQNENDQNDELRCLHALRIVSLLVIIVGHALDWNSLSMFRETFTIRDRISQLSLQPLYRGQLTVDTFIFISGLLTSYVAYAYTGGEYRRFSALKFLIFRYLRLSPQLGTFMLLSALLPALFDGPIWPEMVTAKLDKCAHNWWLNLIYVQNLVDVQNICGLHTWFLAADMQLHIMSLAPLAILLLDRKTGRTICKIVIALGVAWSSATIFHYDLPPGAIRTSKNDFLDEYGMPSDFLKFCYHPFTHTSVFFIGFLFGDHIWHNRKTIFTQITLSQTRKYSLWLAAFILYLATTYSVLPWLYGRPYDPRWSAIIFPLNLLLWSTMLVIIITLCITKNGGIVGYIFASRSSIFPVLSRLTYSVYLTHVWVLYVALGARRDLINIDIASIVSLLLCIIVCSYTIGFVFAILFESPLIQAFRWLRFRLHRIDNDNNNNRLAENKIDNDNVMQQKDGKQNLYHLVKM